MKKQSTCRRCGYEFPDSAELAPGVTADLGSTGPYCPICNQEIEPPDPERTRPGFRAQTGKESDPRPKAVNPGRKRKRKKRR